MNVERMISLMSPTTLASLIADVEMLGAGAEREELHLATLAGDALVANIGKEKADKLIDSFVVTN